MARINIYAEELDKDNPIAIISKVIDGQEFTALRWSLYLPVTLPDGTQARGPFIHRPGDDDSSAVTFWGKQDLRPILRRSLALLDAHYEKRDAAARAHDGGRPFLPL